MREFSLAVLQFLRFPSHLPRFLRVSGIRCVLNTQSGKIRERWIEAFSWICAAIS